VFVLIRCDDCTLSHLVARNLERRGFDVREASSTRAEAPPSRDVRPPDLVVVDLGIQEPEQWERAERVRGEMPRMPLVFLGHAWPTSFQLERLQPCTYVRKPFAIDALLAAVQEAPATAGRFC
jgi:DNA-binding response OmpR family regulator